jgi:hypothetical protein
MDHSEAVAETRPVKWVNWVARALLAVIGIWLLSTLYFVQLEFDDGYTTIANARSLAGFQAEYAWNRAPLIPALLAPVAALAGALGLPSLAVWPYHLLMVLLHFALVVWAWRWLSSNLSARPFTLFAFAAAIPTVLYFSYAPFLSHDLIGGFFALMMLDLGRRFIDAPGVRAWWILVALGALAAMIKQTYALFWAVSLLALALVEIVEGRFRQNWRVMAALGAGAVVSAVVVWLVYAAVLSSSLTSTPFLLRPWLQTIAVPDYFRAYGDLRELFYQWIYLRNAWAHGIAVAVLVIPGLYFCWTSADTKLRAIAIAWLAYVIALHAISFKEVRYAAFLAPLSAVLVWAAIRGVARIRRIYVYPMIALLGADMALATTEATRIFHPYYRTTFPDFFSEVEAMPRDGTRRIIMINNLSFVSPERWAFHGDRYHRITHTMPYHMAQLLNLPAGTVMNVPHPELLTVELLRDGDILTFSNMVVTRNTPVPRDNATTMQPDFLQYLAVSTTLRFELDGDRYLPLDAGGEAHAQPFVLARTEAGEGLPVVAWGSVSAELMTALQGWTTPMSSAELRVLKIRTLCTVRGCERLGAATRTDS